MSDYKVKEGDNLTKIAKAHNMSLQELLKLNNIDPAKANHIKIGQSIKIKSSQADPSTPAEQRFSSSTREAAQEWGKNKTEKINKQSQAAEQAVKTKKEAEKKANASVKTPMQPQLVSKTKAQATNLQEQLVTAGYDLGNTGKNKNGVDGTWGSKSEAALQQAQKDGYVLKDGQLIKPKAKSEQVYIPGLAGLDYAVFAMGQALSPERKPSQETPENEEQSTPFFTTVRNAVSDITRKVTPRQYTAAQNTIEDGIRAPIKRGLAYVVGDKAANFMMPTKVYNENHLSPELYEWLQDAADKKWSPEERAAYFEKNPDAEVKKGWHGRIAGTNIKESDYQKYYNTAYTGPMKNGFTETMFGQGINQAQGTLGSFHLVYTKDGVKIVDDWDFGNGNTYDTSTVMGAVRQWEESQGSQENDNLTPIRSINAFVRYR